MSECIQIPPEEQKMSPSKCSAEEGISKPAQRSQWGKQIEFTLSCLGFSVGIGNLWRFPYLCMRNGGGAFLLPYFLFLILCATPLFLLEIVIAQFSSSGVIEVWNLCPLFKGIGWAMSILSFICTIYFNMIIGWVLYYLGMSFGKDVPWKTCNNTWNTGNCFVMGSNTLYLQNKIHNGLSNISWANASFHREKLTSAAEEFFHNKVLDMSDGIEDVGAIKWDLVICLFFGGLSLYLCIIKGVKSTGKVVYVTATVPYVFLIILLVRGLTLPGSLMGVKFYAIPDWKRLGEFKIWTEACLQVCFSMGPVWGGVITLASYNKFNNNCVRDAVFACLSAGLTSFFGGFVIFSVIGFMAYEAGIPVDKVISQGPGLAFIAYPEAIGKMPLSPFWAICFFLMLFLLALDTQFVCMEVPATAIMDLFPYILRRRRALFLGGVFIINFLVGLPLCTRGGMYMFQIIDWYFAVLTLVLVALLECVICCYVYGVGRLYDDMTLMIKHPQSKFWAVLWAGITPAILLVVFVFVVRSISPPYYGDYTYPAWAIGAGWIIALTSVVPIPAVAIYQLIKAKGTFLERLSYLLRPAPAWGPHSPDDRAAYKYDHHFPPWTARFLINTDIQNLGEDQINSQPEKVPLHCTDVNNV